MRILSIIVLSAATVSLLSASSYSRYPNNYAYEREDELRRADFIKRQEQEKWDSIRKQQEEDKINALKDFYKKSLDDKGQLFLKAIKQGISEFSKRNMNAIFDVIGKKFGKPFLYSVLINLESDDRKIYMNDYFPRNIPESSNPVKINTDFYVTLLTELNNASFPEDSLKKLKGFIKNNIKDETWKKVQTALGESDDDGTSANLSDASIWGKSDNTELKELKKLIKSKNVSIQQVQYQFLQDFTNAYLNSQIQETNDDVNKFLLSTVSKSPKDKMSDAFSDLISKYQTVLSKNGIDSSFLNAVVGIIKKTLANDYPQVTASIYQSYQRQIAGNKRLLDQINNGYRVNLELVFNDYQAVQDKKSVRFNADILCFLCIQVLATFENSLQNSDTPLKNADDYKQRVEALLSDVSTRFNGSGNINSIKDSIIKGAVSQIKDTDLSVLFGLILYQTLDNVKFNDAQKIAVVQGIQKILDGKNVSLDTIKQSVIAYNKNKKENIDFVNALIKVDQSKLLAPFQQKIDNNSSDNSKSDNNLQEKIAKNATDKVNDVVGGFLGKLFG